MTDAPQKPSLIAHEGGSVWHRWDPHIHVPGTLHNNQFGPNSDDEYIARINAADPPARALGITDYYVLDSYRKVRTWVERGLIPNVALVFPNIELRLGVSEKGKAIHLHLLVSPEDPKHIEKAESFLAKLTFKHTETLHCTRDGLMRLGREHDSSIADDHVALRAGAEQFKIGLDDLIKAFEDSPWARRNMLVAVPTRTEDGVSQLSSEGGFAATRKKLERLATVRFTSNEKDRAFYAGRLSATRAQILDELHHLPVCIHGCDAHTMDRVLNPGAEKLCWIKGDLTFEALRQATLDPDGRAFIGAEPPLGASPSNTIRSISISNAAWVTTPKLDINPGLVAVIGARGSGKTALVEMIAAGAHGIATEGANESFLARAEKLIVDETATLGWGSGPDTESSLALKVIAREEEPPRVRYLSQKFVERLCSTEGLSDELVSEIERVVFQAHPVDDRLGAENFDELRQLKTEGARRMAGHRVAELAEIADELSTQRDLIRSRPQLTSTKNQLEAALERQKQDRARLTPNPNKALLARLESVRAAAEGQAQQVVELSKRALSLAELELETKHFRTSKATSNLSELQRRFRETGLSDADWTQFRTDFDGDVDELLRLRREEVALALSTTKGPAKDEPAEAEDLKSAPAYIAPEDVLSEQTLTLLQKEQRRLEALVGVDREKRQRYKILSDRIAATESRLGKLKVELERAEAAPARTRELVSQREVSYRGIFEQIAREEALLRDLYLPLGNTLTAQPGALGRLTFSVHRAVDVGRWAEAGERLLNLTKSGPFRGRGTLRAIATEQLLELWKTGSPAAIASAMSSFRESYHEGFWSHIPDDADTDRETRKVWREQVSAWLFSTEHIQVEYGLEYEGTDIRKLSPGTRGIVLLLLYLAIDQQDDRPLVIDQPEENLDPKSIFDELVTRFKEAKTRRQIIMVTHNANLVVNTDADQVIVAKRGSHLPGRLPSITYLSGGLENPTIRAEVCDILEGGAEAFKQRARRLGIELRQPNTLPDS